MHDAPVWHSFETADTDEAAAAVERLGFRASFAGNRAMAYHEATLATADVVLTDVRFDLEAQCVVDPVGTIGVMDVTRGAFGVRIGPDTFDLPSGALFASPDDVTISIHLREAAARCTFLPAPVLRRTAADVFPESQGRIVTDRVLPRSPDLAALWTSTLSVYRERVLGSDEVFRSDLIRVEATRNLLVTALVAFGMVEPLDGRASESSAVRRAKAHVDEHLEEPVTVEELASAARLSVRALQLAFQRELGTTPMAYLRSARLAVARTRLLAADPTTGTTVSTIVHGLGFLNLGRFAREYRRVFGENPSDTLGR